MKPVRLMCLLIDRSNGTRSHARTSRRAAVFQIGKLGGVRFVREMSVTVYTYGPCSTCRDATKWLRAKGIAFTEKPIRETPPSVVELRRVLKHYDGDLKRLFNSSGMDYRAMGLKDKLPQLSESEALDLLHSNGNLVKRPFLLADDFSLVGFKPNEWENAFHR